MHRHVWVVDSDLTAAHNRGVARARCVDPAEVFAARVLEKPVWHNDAACKEHADLPWVTLPGTNVNTAVALAAMRAVCAGCLVADECRRASAGERGVWAGHVLVRGVPAWAVELDEAAAQRNRRRTEYDDPVDVGPALSPAARVRALQRARQRARAGRADSPYNARPCSTEGCRWPTRSPTGMCPRCRRRAKRQAAATPAA